MRAIVVHQYGAPEVLRFEKYPDPVPRPAEVLVRVAAASVNPIDYKRRAGLTTDFYPLKFPALIGVDAAGTAVKIGPGVEGFSIGDRVFAMADDTYAELCVVNAAALAKVPNGLDLIEAAALPLATTTGNQLLLSHRSRGWPDDSRRKCCWKCWAVGGIRGKDAWGDCDRWGLDEADRRREDYRRRSDRRNRRRHRDGDPSATRCRRLALKWRVNSARVKVAVVQATSTPHAGLQ